MKKVQNKTFTNIPRVERWFDDCFENGVNAFLDFVESNPHILESRLIYCPCKWCKNMEMMSQDQVLSDLIACGFVKEYDIWTFHGKIPRGEDDPLECHKDAASPEWDLVDKI